MSLEMAHKVIVPQKKIISRSFLNSGTLIVIVSTHTALNLWGLVLLDTFLRPKFQTNFLSTTPPPPFARRYKQVLKLQICFNSSLELNEPFCQSHMMINMYLLFYNVSHIYFMVPSGCTGTITVCFRPEPTAQMLLAMLIFPGESWQKSNHSQPFPAIPSHPVFFITLEFSPHSLHLFQCRRPFCIHPLLLLSALFTPLAGRHFAFISSSLF